MYEVDFIEQNGRVLVVITHVNLKTNEKRVAGMLEFVDYEDAKRFFDLVQGYIQQRLNNGYKEVM